MLGQVLGDERGPHLGCADLRPRVLRDALDRPRELDLEPPGQVHAVLGLHDVGDAALARLTVHPHDRLVGPADVLRVDGEVGHLPDVVVVGERGELVCTAPFPSRPLGFWNDPDDRRYHDTYFSRYPNTWYHGDFAEITESGGFIIHGRSDATLNPGGIRIGTADIYRPVESLEAIVDSLVIGQRIQSEELVLLFVKLLPGMQLDDEIRQSIRAAILDSASPRHLPAKIIQVDDIPYTINGKKLELAVRDIVHGEPVRNANSIANPQSLDAFRQWTAAEA